MSWITFIWSLTAGICLTLGAVHLLVWTRRRDQWANLVFSISAIAAAGYAVLDMVALRDLAPVEYGQLWRWALTLGILEGVLIAWFIRLYLQAGRLWLLWLICGLRALMLVLNFVPGANFYFREITGLKQTWLLGELISRPHGVLHPWVILMPLSFVLIILFAIDAAHTAFKRSRQRRAWVLGSLMAVGFSAGLASYALYAREILPSTFSSQLVLSLVLLMGYELSVDVLRAGQLSRELVESQQRMRLAARAADLSLWEWDIVRDEIWTTEKGRERAGIPASERIDFARFLEAVHPDDRDATRRAVRDSLEGGGEFNAEYRMTAQDGVTRWVANRGQVEREAHGKPLRMRGVSADITERKRSEESARNAQELMVAVFNTVPGLLYLYTEAGRLIQWNRQHEVMTGYTSEELLGFRAQDWFDEENWAQVSKVIAKVFSEGYGQIETTLIRKNGEKLPLFATGSKVMIDGKPHMVGIATDISQRKKAEDELAQKRNELSHLSRVTTMSELSSSLAHELNQPLAIILTNAQAAQRLLAQDPPDVAETREILADIVSEDERAGEVIRRLRALLKPGQTQRLPLSVNEIIEDVLRIARSDLIGRGVTVHTALGESPPPVLGDSVQLQQVLLNLILNASDAMAANPPAQRHLTITTAHRDGWVRISVSDNGRGLPAEPERIFQPFYTTKKDGLGLGLPICRSIATAHQGRLWAEANEKVNSSPASTYAGQGTTLQLELPTTEGKS